MVIDPTFPKSLGGVHVETRAEAPEHGFRLGIGMTLLRGVVDITECRAANLAQLLRYSSRGV